MEIPSAWPKSDIYTWIYPWIGRIDIDGNAEIFTKDSV